MATKALKTVGETVEQVLDEHDLRIAFMPCVPNFPDYCYDINWNIYRRATGRVLRPFARRHEGGRIGWTLRRNNRRTGTLFRAVLVCTHYHGPRPDGMGALHYDGDATNDTGANLRWGTHKENMQDRARHGRHPYLRGERHGRAILSAENVRAIRASAAKHTELARQYGVTPGAIQHARARITWKEVA